MPRCCAGLLLKTATERCLRRNDVFTRSRFRCGVYERDLTEALNEEVSAMDCDRLNFPVLAKRPYSICNMVMTVDGKATIVGTIHDLVDQADHQAMQRLRLHADPILSAFGTPARPRTPPALQGRTAGH